MTRARPPHSYCKRSGGTRVATISLPVTAALGIAPVAIAVVLEQILPADCVAWCRQGKNVVVVALLGFILLFASGLGLTAVLA